MFGSPWSCIQNRMECCNSKYWILPYRAPTGLSTNKGAVNGDQRVIGTTPIWTYPQSHPTPCSNFRNVLEVVRFNLKNQKPWVWMEVSTCICAKTSIIAIHFKAIDFWTLWLLPPPKKITNIEPLSGSAIQCFQADHFCRLGSVLWRPISGRPRWAQPRWGPARFRRSRPSPKPTHPPPLPVTRLSPLTEPWNNVDIFLSMPGCETLDSKMNFLHADFVFRILAVPVWLTWPSKLAVFKNLCWQDDGLMIYNCNCCCCWFLSWSSRSCNLVKLQCSFKKLVLNYLSFSDFSF